MLSSNPFVPKMVLIGALSAAASMISACGGTAPRLGSIAASNLTSGTINAMTPSTATGAATTSTSTPTPSPAPAGVQSGIPRSQG